VRQTGGQPLGTGGPGRPRDPGHGMVLGQVEVGAKARASHPSEQSQARITRRCMMAQYSDLP